MNDIQHFHQQGLSVSAISDLTGFTRRTVRKYLEGSLTPHYGPRPVRPSRLDPFKAYLQERLTAGVWNATVLLREIRERGYSGGYTLLTDYLRPLRHAARGVAVRRFETPAGHQAQADWCDLGDITFPDDTRQKLYGFVLTLGYSRAMFCAIATDQKQTTFLRLHEAAFDYLGGIPHEILYDNTKTVVRKTLTEGVDGRGEVGLNPLFEDFARYWGFTPRLCRPYRPQTKGKVENGIGYLRKNFVCGCQAASLEDLQLQLNVWLADVANVRVHGTTHRVVAEAWAEERPQLQPLSNRRAYPLVVEAVRRVTRDAYVAYQSNYYSVPWQAAGQEVLVREIGNQIEILRETQILAVHPRCPGRAQTLTLPAHHAGIPTSGRKPGKARLCLKGTLPEVEVRPLSVYDALAQREEVA